jgi:RIO kinase 1
LCSLPEKPDLKIPRALEPLIEDGIIDEVLRPLKSGKEAAVYLVRSGGTVRCAKVYKDLGQRSFQQRTVYQEGRRVRGSRQARAMARSTRFGRREQEEAWKNAEVDALYQLAAAGVRVPAAHGFFNGVLVMELISDADGNPAPRLGDLEFTPEEARSHHAFLVQQVVRMLCAGLVHGDLSEYNVLVDPAGPVIIDLPQAVNAMGNNHARAMLLRDVANITGTLARFVPELAGTHFGEEMWARFEEGSLAPDTLLTGTFTFDETPADVAAVQAAIDDAREEALRRELARQDQDP